MAATWTALTEPQPLTIAFATTCVGSGNNIKAAMADARKKSIETITSQLKNIPPTANSWYAPNKTGNCPEFMTRGITCREEGKYVPLFNVEYDPKANVYQCCEHCEDMLQLWGANDIKIEDLWKESVMSCGKPDKTVTYPFQALKSLEVILAEFKRE